MWKTGEIAPKEQYLLFSTIFSIYLLQESNYIFICEMWLFHLFFLNAAYQICWGTDISKYFESSITKTCLFKYTENFTTKKWKFSDKTFWYLHISAQNIDCGYSLEIPQRGGSYEYPQYMFWAEIRKNNVYPCTALFYYIKVGFKGAKLYRYVFVMLRLQDNVSPEY